MSNPEFESGPPSIYAIEIARVVDRGIRESGMIDLKKLVIKEGEKVWTIALDIYPINDDGNLFDAAFLAGVAALQDAFFPEYNEKKGKIEYDKRTKKRLPISGIPTSVTVLKIKDKFLLDASTEEWGNVDSRLTVVWMKDKICAMQKGGEAPLTTVDIDTMVGIAEEQGKKFKALFKE